MHGVDVSHWNGAINWQELLLDQSFAIMKVSQNVSKDPKFAQYYADAISHGFTQLGAYIFNDVYTVQEAKREANYAVSILKGKALPMGVWLDAEKNAMKSLGKKMLTDILTTEADILEAAGYKVGIYCSLDWYKNVLNSAKLSRMYPFWIARYPKKDRGIMIESLSPLMLDGCAAWQYSSKGNVDGIKGNVDLDVTDEDIKRILQTGVVIRPICPYDEPKVTLYRFRPLMKANDVSWMQWHLNRIGYYNGNIDGKFGPLTNAALGLFQREEFEEADFRCGPATRAALKKQMSYFE